LAANQASKIGGINSTNVSLGSFLANYPQRVAPAYRGGSVTGSTKGRLEVCSNLNVKHEMVTAVEAAQHICLSPSRFRDLVAQGVFKRMPSGNTP
jgi:hypothetical protein